MPCTMMADYEPGSDALSRVIQLEKRVHQMETNKCKADAAAVKEYVDHRLADLDYVIKKCVEAGDVDTLRMLTRMGAERFIWLREEGNKIAHKYLAV